MEISPFRRDLPLGEVLSVPFWGVTIARPLLRFNEPLGLKPNQRELPSANLAAAIVFGRRSFEAMVRNELGDAAYRNLRNYALGRVKTPRSLGTVLASCDGDQALVNCLVDLLRFSESSGLARMCAAIEGAAYRLMKYIRSRPAPCPCCGATVVRSAQGWWARQPCDLGLEEALLVDRACMVASALHVFVHLTDDAKHTPPPTLQRLRTHPNANWLLTVARVLSSPTLSNLPPRAGAAVTDETILRISRGDMLTPDVVNQVLAKVERSGALRAAVITTRTMAFAIEFLRAANRSAELDADTARQVVAARIDTLISEALHCLSVAGQAKPINHEGAGHAKRSSLEHAEERHC